MDVGVGWYVVVNAMSRSNALTESESSELFKATPTQSRVPKWAMHSVPLLMLGLLRLAAVKLLGYHVSKAEYGLHWNFFFTLFSVRVRQLKTSWFQNKVPRFITVERSEN